MSNFKVFTIASGKSGFDDYEDGSSYRIEDGRLIAKHADNTRRTYAPGHWTHVDDVAPKKKGSRGVVLG